jgi:hypothetical protein
LRVVKTYTKKLANTVRVGDSIDRCGVGQPAKGSQEYYRM